MRRSYFGPILVEIAIVHVIVLSVLFGDAAVLLMIHASGHMHSRLERFVLSVKVY